MMEHVCLKSLADAKRKGKKKPDKDTHTHTHRVISEVKS